MMLPGGEVAELFILVAFRKTCSQHAKSIQSPDPITVQSYHPWDVDPVDHVDHVDRACTGHRLQN